MLVLTRKVGEAIVLPANDVTIQVVRIDGTRVRLGITAPEEVSVCRQELRETEDAEETRLPDHPNGKSRSRKRPR